MRLAAPAADDAWSRWALRLPLPLVSFGGSSMLTFTVAFGLLQSIPIRKKRRFSL